MARTGAARKVAKKPRGTASRTLRDDDPWLLKRLIESINSGLIVLDGEDRVITFNTAAEHITGFDRASIYGQHFIDCLGPRNRETLRSELVRATSAMENREFTLLTKEGSRVPIGYTSSPLVDEAGEALGTVIIFKELTEIFSLRQEIQRREHLSTVGEMTALIAHEIRNPLAAMHTAAETLKGELGYDEEKEEYLDIIIHEIKRVANLVSNFFAYVRPVELNLQRLDVHELLDLLVFIEGGKMRQSGVEVACHYAPDIPAVKADRTLLQQALLNILLNAFQASAVGTTVTISTSYEESADGALLSIAIADSGEGISEEGLKRIFKPFYSTKTKGIGLGLAITDRIVKAMNGKIELESEVGVGSTFTLSLPVVPA